MGIMRISLLLLVLSKATTKTIACGFLIVVIGIAISASSVFVMLPAVSNQQQSAFATFPGENGKIAFTSNTEMVMTKSIS
jgi:hypothetical protein